MAGGGVYRPEACGKPGVIAALRPDFIA
jgi:hypothetical protein